MWYDALDRGPIEAFLLPVGPMKTEALAEEKAAPRRRSTRILLRVPLIINVVGDSVETEWEPVETITVSKHGAMVRAKQDFQVGATLEIRVRNKDRTARARVAWRSAEVTPQGVEVGFEILDDEGFWEISFPPDRWSARMEPHKSNP
ncbi:MAG: PilZ domain-containing protein [Acidobacteriia bacterium]|nr:PilZ domain-containing protein [Terriglobia bacterium]